MRCKLCGTINIEYPLDSTNNIRYKILMRKYKIIWGTDEQNRTDEDRQI